MAVNITLDRVSQDDHFDFNFFYDQICDMRETDNPIYTECLYYTPDSLCTQVQTTMDN